MLEELRTDDARLSMETRRWLAAEAFSYTARYDTAISRWFAEGGEEDFPGLHVRAYERVLELPYGENPHQRAAFYEQVGARRHVLSHVRQLHGKELSYNNLLDLDAARALARDFGERPACVIVKHNNPCGAAVGSDALDAYRRAFACDPVSAFGGIIVLNRPVDRATAEALAEQFLEVLLAPGYEDGALEVLQRKPNVRLLEDEERRGPDPRERAVRQVEGGLLVQDRDRAVLDPATMHVATERHPTEAEWRDLLFAWAVGAHVKSNAIVLARGERDRRRRRGPDEPGRQRPARRREGPVRPAAARRWPPTRSSRSPTGPSSRSPPASRRSSSRAARSATSEVIAAAQEAGVAMVLTGRRHFRH